MGKSWRDRLILGTFGVFVGIVILVTQLDIGPVVLPMLKANENNPTAYYNRGNRYLYSDPGYAITYFNHALELDPDYVDALYQRALAYSRVDNTEAALADLDQLVRLAPGEALYVLARANLHNDLGHLEAALQDYDLALRIDPEYAAIYFSRANAYYDAGEKDAALQDYLAFLDRYRFNDQIYRIANQRVEELTGTG
jgi:tetratricopeptide (TPR) repeat protein